MTILIDICLKYILSLYFYTKKTTPENHKIVMYFLIVLVKIFSLRFFFIFQDDLSEANVKRGFNYKPAVNNEVYNFLLNWRNFHVSLIFQTDFVLVVNLWIVFDEEAIYLTSISLNSRNIFLIMNWIFLHFSMVQQEILHFQSICLRFVKNIFPTFCN